jgi:pimeloyl-ACP methyl ester carboxylesterase
MSSFKEGVLECNGLPMRYAESGEGPPVVIFPAGDDALFADLAAGLATHNRDIVFDAPASGGGKLQGLVEHVAQSLARLEIMSFSVIGVSQGATLALAYTVYAPERIHRLILLSPLLASVQHSELEAKLRAVKAPTLVLVGTRDRSGSQDAGRVLREQMPSCHLLLVYDAGHAIATERCAACVSPISEFLTHGEGFIVSHESQMIRP